MSENIVKPQHPFLFFLSRTLNLTAMVIGLGLVGLFVGTFVSIYLFDLDILGNPNLFTEYETNPKVLNALKVIQCLSTAGAFLVPALIFPRYLQRWSMPFLHIDNKPSPFTLGAAVLLLLLSLPFNSWLQTLNEQIKFPEFMADFEKGLVLKEEAAEKMSLAFARADGLGMLLVNIFVMALLPAICEEFFFRGALMRFLMMCMKNRHLSIALSAIIFSAVHFQFYGFLPRVALGMVLGYIAWYSNSIWPGVLFHFLNNALILVAMYYHWDKSSLAIFDSSYHFPIVVSLLSGVLTVAMIVLMRNQRYKTEWYNGE